MFVLNKGFDCVQVLMGCNSVDELDAAKRIVDDFYLIYHDQLEVLERIRLNGLEIVLNE